MRITNAPIAYGAKDRGWQVHRGSVSCEETRDGFVITAFLTRRTASLNRENTIMAIAHIEEYLKLVPAVKKTPQQALWLSYDQEADSLYVNFKKPSHATDSELTDEDVIVRYEGDQVIGFTVLHASHRLASEAGKPALVREKPAKKYGR